MPGGNCPYCNQKIKVERRGKQNCPKCGGRIDVVLTDAPIPGAQREGKSFHTRCTLKAVHSAGQRDEDEKRWKEIQEERLRKKFGIQEK